MFTAILNFLGIRTTRQKEITLRRSNAAKAAWVHRKRVADNKLSTGDTA